MSHIVIFTGAGVSSESGLSTFRDSDGLWNNYRIEDVCTHTAWLTQPKVCVDFYNQRRKDVLAAQPNAAHIAIAQLQQRHPHCTIITQNIDDLHERAGATNVIHLHGEITKLRAENDANAIIPFNGWEQQYGERHPNGHLLRPHVVFFGEDVPNMIPAVEVTQQADIMVVVGTSLNVYPAAMLLHYLPAKASIFLIDPGSPNIQGFARPITHISKTATLGVPELLDSPLFR